MYIHQAETESKMVGLGDSFVSDLIALNQNGKIGARGRFCAPNGSPKVIDHKNEVYKLQLLCSQFYYFYIYD